MPLRPLLSLCCLLALFGCRSKITGNEGNLDFSYVADDDLRNFNKPIAVGAKLDLKVAEAGTNQRVELQSATSSAPAVLKVASFQGDTLVLEGAGDGGALISVTATLPDGSVKPDSVNMLARVPEVLKLFHTCTTAAEARYLVSQDIWLGYDFSMKNGQAVIGYGYFPVTYSPPGGVTQQLTSKDQQFLHLATAATRQTVTVSSTLDATTATLHLVEPADVDGADFYDAAHVATTRKGTTGYYNLVVSVGGRPVCQAFMDNSATSTTPDVCEVSKVAPADTPATGPKNEFGWVKVQGKAPGTCHFTVTWTQARGGQGLTVPFSVTITG